ncbi:helix-turn-helix transcriptional regulator [Kitasatospora sp. NPDC050543]|uniref:helix-turn-helix transcriptional regulator n=1 Tax=Kitasatospora sp. NPDC050543 TaxID=3364054 RepID=UPI00379EB423
MGFGSAPKPQTDRGSSLVRGLRGEMVGPRSVPSAVSSAPERPEGTRRTCGKECGAGMLGVNVSRARQMDAGFGDMLRALRHEAGLTHEELARRSQVSVRTISDIERGRVRRPHRRSVQQLAAALDLGAAHLERFLRAARSLSSDGPDRPHEGSELPHDGPGLPHDGPGLPHDGPGLSDDGRGFPYEAGAAGEPQSALVVMVVPLKNTGGNGPCCRRRRRCSQPRPASRSAAPVTVPSPVPGRTPASPS